MKKIFVAIILSLLFVSVAVSAELEWDAPMGEATVDGYILCYGEIGQVPTEIDIVGGDVTTYDLDALNLAEGTRYEFYLKAYNMAGISPQSNFIRWTQPVSPIVIETLGQPVNIIINTKE